MKKETLELIKEWNGFDFTIPELQERFIEELEKVEGLKYKGAFAIVNQQFTVTTVANTINVIQFFPDKINVYDLIYYRKNNCAYNKRNEIMKLNNG